MKTKNLMFLGLIFLLLIYSSNFVLAKDYAGIGTLDLINNWIDIAKTGTNPDADLISDTVVYTSVFIILCIVFADAISIFSPLSKKAAYFVGFFLGIIAMFTGLVSITASFLARVTAFLGVLSVFGSLGIIFVMYFLLHIFLFKWFYLLKRAQTKEQIDIAVTGYKAIKEIGKEVRK